MKHTAKRLGKGHYLYRGFEIMCVGYYPPEHRICWECIDEDGMSGFGHGFSLNECKMWIDIEIDKNNIKKGMD